MRFSMLTLFCLIVGYVAGLPFIKTHGKIDHLTVLKNPSQIYPRDVDFKIKPYAPKYDSKIGLKSESPLWPRSYDRIRRVLYGVKWSGGHSKDLTSISNVQISKII
ncbi:uncharacterized protein MELLADRAFT_102028 [Melampsora larici-populina 98AG31]|uniref:Secreted protein n=1 Tax=Melampsora larici-populina (strain 98AG31 / pathotype 3-4-7) TaxID=747676 RepID=F4R5Q9_MELLP|nr:uncharacterized protein MELLADRAFT_102028 [Melampsora larici-populina 98AG31]EGG12218.1 secreted protein [Melampsora larici-populina 98AG31]